MTWHIASVSWGKDSLAMLHLLIDQGMPLDEVAFYDTGAEFPAIYRERDRTLPLLAENGIKYTELRPQRPFFYDMLAKPVHKRNGSIQRGYGWCGGPCRWGTSEKTRALDRYAKSRNATVFVGIAADETRRIGRGRAEWKQLPLVDAGMTEADCLELCYERGHTWEQDGVRLYDMLDRDALLALADEMLSTSIEISSVDSIRPLEAAYLIQGYARRIRDACGVTQDD